MLPERFSEAWVNQTHTVLGKRLPPFCLWHRLALEIIESPFLAPDGQPTLKDLTLAVRICRSRYPLGGAASFSRILELDGKKPGMWQKLRFALFANRVDLAAEGKKFARYVGDFHSLPEFWSDSHGHPDTKGDPPVVLSVVTQLISGGFSEEAAWTMPTGQAYWHAATLARINGAKIVFLSESPKLFSEIQRLKDLVASGKIKFTKKGVEYRP